MTLKTRIFTHLPRVSLARFTFCWWRHNRLAMTSQWSDNCDANTWQVISNSLDIDFIHGDIHGRSCKKIGYSMSVDVIAKDLKTSPLFQTEKNCWSEQVPWHSVKAVFTGMIPSYLCNGNSYTCKTPSLYWDVTKVSKNTINIKEASA